MKYPAVLLAVSEAGFRCGGAIGARVSTWTLVQHDVGLINRLGSSRERAVLARQSAQRADSFGEEHDVLECFMLCASARVLCTTVLASWMLAYAFGSRTGSVFALPRWRLRGVH